MGDDLTAEIVATTNGSIDAQIEALESVQLMPRPMRDIILERILAQAKAAGLTEANLLDSAHPGYHEGYEGLYRLHARIDALRRERV